MKKNAFSYKLGLVDFFLAIVLGNAIKMNHRDSNITVCVCVRGEHLCVG